MKSKNNSNLKNTKTLKSKLKTKHKTITTLNNNNQMTPN